MQNNDNVLETVRARMGSSGLTPIQRRLVVAAFEGEAQLESAVEGLTTSEHTGGEPEEPTDPLPHHHQTHGGDEATAGSSPSAAPTGVGQGTPAKAFLKSVTVTGFRGIGSPATLSLRPGPGLTIVVGRNGSGKSSFAEGIEAALTGRIFRLDQGPAVWRGALRNLHEQANVPTRVSVEMVVDGEQGSTTVHRTWSDKDVRDVQDSECRVERAGTPSASFGESGWESALETYRPFLSYPELGKVAGKPHETYDALASILGLERFVEAAGRLNAQRKRLDDEVKESKAEYEQLVEELAAVNDDRAREARAALTHTHVDFDGVSRIAAGVLAPQFSEVALARRMADLEFPDAERVATVVTELREAAEAMAALQGTAVDESQRLADLLEQALDHRARHADEASCPVCGTERVLDAAWAEGARAKVAGLRHSAEQVDVASERVRRALSNAHGLLADPPAWLPPDSPVRSAWITWTAGRTDSTAATDPTALADHLEQAFPLLRDGGARARDQAKLDLQSLEENWQPLAHRLTSWVERARSTDARKSMRGDVKKALEWVKRVGTEERDERFRSLAKESGENWRQLRQQSNVEIGPIRLEGSATRRQLVLEAAVDGRPASLGVLSQGEVYSLALALFLPRMNVEESPFGFVVIDDPVQSMDPAKVDGLARVLADTAKTRQVVVFTHDTRLTDAVRRLPLHATVQEVVRREGSGVRLRKNESPAKRALSDADAVLDRRSQVPVPEFVARRTVPGLCRIAVEAALTDLTWRRRMAQSDSHADVQEELDRTNSTAALASLAYPVKGRRRETMRDRFSHMYEDWAGEVFKICCQAPHESYQGDLRSLVADTRKLVERIDAEG